MKRNILVLFVAAVLAFAFSFTTVGCKKKAPEATDEVKKEEMKEPVEAKKEEMKDEKKEEPAK